MANMRYTPARSWSQFSLDAIGWLGAIPVAALLRYEFNMFQANWFAIVILAVVMAAVQYLVGYAFSLYRSRYKYGSFEEVRAVTWAATVEALTFGLATLVLGPYIGIPRSVVFIALPFALVWMLGTRYVKRLLIERSRRPGGDAEPTIIYGAGYLGESLVRQMTTDPISEYRPVALLDDDPSKEACQLVVQAGGIRRAGEVLILDMGEPVKILDIAKRMIEISGKQVDIVFTGLRDGEKLHEELIGADEHDERPFHPKISHAQVSTLNPEVLDRDGWFERLLNSTEERKSQ